MAITYNNLYLDIRKKLRQADAADPTLEARELVCFATGKTREELMRDGRLYLSPEMEKQVWALVQRHLEGVEIKEFFLENGAVMDCIGCSYSACIHFGEQGGCFYGSVMQDEVYPAVRRADAIVMVCPNYNDAISANLTAFVNRLTALFRQTRFYDKALFAIVVSGYSGGDIVARQLVGGLNMNKSFHLPGNFALIETANAPGEALTLPDIDTRLDAFAQTILNTLCN